jgi:hypothetical protein
VWDVWGVRTLPEDGGNLSSERSSAKGNARVYVRYTTDKETVAQARSLATRQHVRGSSMRTIDDVLNRLRAEYLDRQGLRLNPEQAQRLCHIDRTICQMMLDALVNEAFLCVQLDGYYARLTTGHHPHPAKADLKANKYAKAS